MSRCRNSVLSLTDDLAHSQGVVPLGDEKNPFEGIGMAELPDRFWEKVEKTETCWLWIASTDKNGYGKFGHDRGWKLAHRVCYEALVGPIPNGLQIDHLCRVRNCVNPQHLEPVSSRENTLRGETLAATHARKTRCPQGHEYSSENTIVLRSGWRRCRECNRQQLRRRPPGRRELAV